MRHASGSAGRGDRAGMEQGRCARKQRQISSRTRRPAGAQRNAQAYHAGTTGEQKRRAECAPRSESGLKAGRTKSGRRKYSHSRDATRAVRPIKVGKRSRALLLSLRDHPSRVPRDNLSLIRNQYPYTQLDAASLRSEDRFLGQPRRLPDRPEGRQSHSRSPFL